MMTGRKIVDYHDHAGSVPSRFGFEMPGIGLLTRRKQY